MRAPAALHDVLGEEPDGRELLAILAFALHGRREQTFVAGLLLATGMTLCAALPQSTALRVASALFVMKVAFSFAVDHDRDARGESRS